MTPKLRRWIDLLAALLRRKYAVTLEDLCPEVPGYPGAGTKQEIAARRRMFERDKRELRDFGIPIATVPIEDKTGYSLDRAHFYLPYLELLKDGRKTTPKRVGRFGYHSLPSLCFEPDELSAIYHVGARIERLGIPGLAADARSAVRKLGHDLPMPDDEGDDGVRLLHRNPAAEAGVFDSLGEALTRRKRVTFSYHSIGRDDTSRRTVEPYGLFYLGNHWYLAAVAPGEGLVKKFRLSRISDVEVNPVAPDTPDFSVPKSFKLKEHAESKHAWELGSGDLTEVLVRVTAETGTALAAMEMGDPVGGDPTARRFRVRRLDAFARWILGAGGAVVPLSPPELVTAFRDQVRAALAQYAGEAR
jgi:predicted DNA-binding transcriptional regulator YafY